MTKHVDPVPGTQELYKEGEPLPSEVLALPYGQRPMIWQDVADFGLRHGRTGSDVVYDLALLSKNRYTEDVKRPDVAPIDLELLMSLYDISPSSCGWKLPSARDVFLMLYGPVINQFTPGTGGWDTKDYKSAELFACRRYARLLGRGNATTYRWLQREGKVTRRLANVLDKIVTLCGSAPVPHLRFEELAGPVLLRRGVNIDAVAPLPTAENVRRPPGTRGRRVSDGAESRTVPAKYIGGAFS